MCVANGFGKVFIHTIPLPFGAFWLKTRLRNIRFGQRIITAANTLAYQEWEGFVLNPQHGTKKECFVNLCVAMEQKSNPSMNDSTLGLHSRHYPSLV